MSKRTLHPIAAELAAAIVRAPDKKSVSLPPDAVNRARAKLRAGHDAKAIEDLIALAVKTWRLVGKSGDAVIDNLCTLVAEAMGSAAAARDLFAQAGVPAEASKLLAQDTEVRAPAAAPAPTTAPAPKIKRGLAKK